MLLSRQFIARAPRKLSLASQSDAHILQSIASGKLSLARLEEAVDFNHERAVRIRRKALGDTMSGLGMHDAATGLDKLPLGGYDYSEVFRRNCESVIGHIPLPVGAVGPITIDGKPFLVPMATTEGALVASVNRGAKALGMGDGIKTAVLRCGMTRSPLLQFDSFENCAKFVKFASNPANVAAMAAAFDRTSRFARLQSVSVQMSGRLAFVRLSAFTGDAMGMNMVTRGAQAVVDFLRSGIPPKDSDVVPTDGAAAAVEQPVHALSPPSSGGAVSPCPHARAEIDARGFAAPFPEVELLTLSSNTCSDKKSTGVNWTNGRGYSVVASAVVPAKVLKTVLKSNAKAIADMAFGKVYLGSTLAGALGGANAHAANTVAAIFAATGQDLAQVTTSSAAMVSFRAVAPHGAAPGTPAEDYDLEVDLTMPIMEVGTVGGGTALPAQRACLEMLGVAGASTAPKVPGANAAQLSRVVAATVLAAELNLHASLAANHLLSAHLSLNRAATPAPAAAV